MIREKLMAQIRQINKPSEQKLAQALGVDPKDKKDLHKIIEDMIQKGELFRDEKGILYPIDDERFLRGRIQGTGRDFLFFIPENKEKEDLFVAMRQAQNAIHNDEVIVEKIKGQNGKEEGKVRAILSRPSKLTGRYEDLGSFGFVHLDERKYGFDLFIQKSKSMGAEDNDVVVCRIDKVDFRQGRHPEGRITKIIGPFDERGVDLAAIAIQFDLPDEFPQAVLDKAEAIPQEVEDRDRNGRTDFRELTTVTIDGADAKDFDDAISVFRKEDGYVLYVHIADVSHYVVKNSALDKEAERRGNSVYMLDKVIPMLPFALSNGICSLNPQVDRLTLTVKMEINNKGKVSDYKFYESVIRSDARLVYDPVSDFLEGKTDHFMNEDIDQMLRVGEELKNILRQKRKKRGALEFDFQETKIVFDDQGKPIEIYGEKTRTANELIEEFMLVTNETVGQHYGFLHQPFMYRVHEEPDEEKIAAFRQIAYNFGYQLKGKNTFSKDFQILLEQIRDKPEEALLSKLLLRAMKKAHYSEQPEIHFGLATMFYSHFTSPIRRYPDLFIHRIVKDTIHNRPSTQNEKAFLAYIRDIAEKCSKNEQKSENAEREATDMKSAEYMENHIGEEYSGVITSITNFGFFVQLPNTVEGLVRFEYLKKDHYHFDEKNYLVRAEHSGRVFSIGQTVKIRVLHASKEKRQIDFEWIEE